MAGWFFFVCLQVEKTGGKVMRALVWHLFVKEQENALCGLCAGRVLRLQAEGSAQLCVLAQVVAASLSPTSLSLMFCVSAM